VQMLGRRKILSAPLVITGQGKEPGGGDVCMLGTPPEVVGWLDMRDIATELLKVRHTDAGQCGHRCHAFVRA